MNETIAQEAKRLLELIPENLWTTGKYLRVTTSTTNQPQCCGLGHWNRLHATGEYTVDSCLSGHHVNTIDYSVYKFLGQSPLEGSFAYVNDGKNERYQQPTPKQRVMALLDDMISAGY